MKPNRGTTAKKLAPSTPGMFPITPGRLARLASSENNTSSSSGSGSESSVNANNDGSTRDEVAVHCRLRPLLRGENELQPCVEVVDKRTIHLHPPEKSRAFIAGRQGTATAYTFKEVFDGDSSQKAVFDEVSLPLVKDLLLGKNGLLLTYGVTGSGKTHTMQGSARDPGVMVRAIDVIFNSLQNRLVSRKNMVISDRLNDFQVQSIVDAALTEQNDMISGRQRARGAQNGRYGGGSGFTDIEQVNLSNRVPDTTTLNEVVDDNRTYAVFISYCEIYNTYIYDLLEDARDPITGRPKYDTKSLREDAYGNMFVYGSTEIEVRSSSEALEAFYRGQKRRRVAATVLNQESSRSHAIFNIRLVKAYPSGEGEIDLEKPCLVSQLALVDLAGSERTSRTGNAGQAIKEAGRINNSLMNLRRCMERLRENQKYRNGPGGGVNSAGGNVPYRDDKLTHLFRNFFEGIGSVKMIVCINPSQQDFDENVHVLQFAEMASEVHIERIDPIPREFGMTHGQRRANELMKEALRNTHGQIEIVLSNSVYSPIYSLGPAWPEGIAADADTDDVADTFIPFLERRIQTRNTLIPDFGAKQEEFRGRLVEMEKELILLREENSKLRHLGEGDKRRIRDLEGRLVNAEAANSSLQRRCDAFTGVKATLEVELDQKELLLSKQKKEQKRTNRRYQNQISQERNVNTELAERIKDQDDEKERIEQAKAKLRAVSHIVNGEDPETRIRARGQLRTPVVERTTSDPDISFSAAHSRSSAAKRKPLVPTRSDPNMSANRNDDGMVTPRRSVVVSNPRHRRSRSAGVLWVDHQPGPGEPPLVTKSTIMQPDLKGRDVKTTRGCPSDKVLRSPRASRYCLTTQDQDTDGELQTKIFKADIIPTSTGGRQIVFDDVEVLKQQSPTKENKQIQRNASPERTTTRRRSKRSYENVDQEKEVGMGGVGRRIAALEAAGAAFQSGAGNIESAYSGHGSKKFRL